MDSDRKRAKEVWKERGKLVVKVLEYIMLKWKSSSYRQDLYFSQWYQDFEIIWICGNTCFGFLKYTLSKYYFTFLCGNWTESQSFLCFQYPLIFFLISDGLEKHPHQSIALYRILQCTKLIQHYWHKNTYTTHNRIKLFCCKLFSWVISSKMYV